MDGWITVKNAGAWMIGLLTTLFIGAVTTYFAWLGTNVVAMRTDVAVAISQQKEDNIRIVSRVNEMAEDIDKLQELAENDRFRISRLEYFKGIKK